MNQKKDKIQLSDHFTYGAVHMLKVKIFYFLF